jgi:hypothetical protein
MSAARRGWPPGVPPPDPRSIFEKSKCKTYLAGPRLRFLQILPAERSIAGQNSAALVVRSHRLPRAPRSQAGFARAGDLKGAPRNAAPFGKPQAASSASTTGGRAS